MRAWYVAGCLFLCALLACCYIKAKRKNDGLSSAVSKLIAVSLIGTFAYGTTLISIPDICIKIATGIYLASATWNALYLLRYTIDLSSELTYTKRAIRMIFHAIVLSDTILMLLYPWMSPTVTLAAKWNESQPCRTFYGASFYGFHFIFCCFLMISCCINLYMSYRKETSLYRIRYGAILLSVFGAVLFSSVLEINGIWWDASLLFFDLLAVEIYFFSFCFVKPLLMKSVERELLRSTQDCVIAFDNCGQLLLCNEATMQMLGPLSDGVTVEEFGSIRGLYCKEDLKQPFMRDTIVSWNGEKKIFRCTYHRIHDRGGFYLGCYFHFADITEDMERYREQAYLAEHDSFTGLMNKSTFCEKTRHILKQNPHETYYIICSNIKEFKLINENFGTKVGNETLKKIAGIIQEICNETVLGCRMESDHFAVFMPQSRFDEREIRLLSRIPLDVHGRTYLVQNCFGVYPVQPEENDVEAMCERALMAMDAIHANGDCCAFYDDSIRERLLYEQRLQERFPVDLKAGRFCLYIQPQIDCQTGKYSGAEALVRWIDTDGTLIAPDRFIPLFERCGMIAQMDRYVWEQACMLLCRWCEGGLAKIPLSVNISGRDFTVLNLFDEFTTLVKQYRIPPQLLRLEITETIFVQQSTQLTVIERLREAGFYVEMDDFGSGYSSLNMLKSVPVDAIKLDMGFLRNCEESEKGIAILNSVVGLINTLDMHTIAEGVETKEQVELLANMGNRYMQGFYFSPPIPVESYQELLKKQV